MQDIASKRRDNVALFKKIFLYVKIFFMAVLSVLGSIFFVWSTYCNQLSERQIRNGEPSMEGFAQYFDGNVLGVISSVICCLIACSIVAFLVFHGIQTLVVRFMMRKANTGGK